MRTLRSLLLSRFLHPMAILASSLETFPVVVMGTSSLIRFKFFVVGVALFLKAACPFFGFSLLFRGFLNPPAPYSFHRV